MPKKSTPDPEPTPEAAPELAQATVPEATPAAVSEAAAALGRRARGVPKTLTEERREELRAAAAHARGFRVRARPAPAPEATPAPAPQPPTTGRRITARVLAPRIVAPTPGDVAAFGRG